MSATTVLDIYPIVKNGEIETITTITVVVEHFRYPMTPKSYYNLRDKQLTRHIDTYYEYQYTEKDEVGWKAVSTVMYKKQLYKVESHLHFSRTNIKRDDKEISKLGARYETYELLDKLLL